MNLGSRYNRTLKTRGFLYSLELGHSWNASKSSGRYIYVTNIFIRTIHLPGLRIFLHTKYAGSYLPSIRTFVNLLTSSRHHASLTIKVATSHQLHIRVSHPKELA